LRLGLAGQGKARQGLKILIAAWLGGAGLGAAWHGEDFKILIAARLGWAGQGKAGT